MNWKAPPQDETKTWVNKSLELQILLNCNWSCHACFVSNTKVQMASGKSRKISEISVGDSVVSYDEKTKMFRHNKVTNTMARQVNEIYKLETSGWKPTYVTGNHPILVKNKGWVDVKDLRPKDVILHISESERKSLNNGMHDPEVAKRMGKSRRGIKLNLSEEGRERISTLARERMLSDNPMKNPETAVKGFLNRKDRGKMSSSEILTMDAAKCFGLKFVGGGDLVVGNKIPDFLIEGTNKLIEVWAKSCTSWLGRDKKWENERRKLFEEEGYEVLFLPVKCGLAKGSKPEELERCRIRKEVADYKRNGVIVEKVTKITRDSNPKAWTRLAGRKDLPVTVYNLEVENDHTYIVNSMIVHNCDQFSNLPSISWVRKGRMTVVQVEYFAAEMVTTNSYIGRVRVLGGEPTLHNKFREILEILQNLVHKGHLGQVEVITNGSNMNPIQKNRDLINKVRVSNEKDKEKHHTANLAATPATLGYEGKICSAPWHCGISLNYYGYFPCSSGAGLARLMSDMDRWQRLRLPQQKIMEEWPDLQQLCNHCYHALRPEDKVRCGMSNFEANTPHPEMWKHLGPWLHGKQPDWKIYGGQTSAR